MCSRESQKGTVAGVQQRSKKQGGHREGGYREQGCPLLTNKLYIPLCTLVIPPLHVLVIVHDYCPQEGLLHAHGLSLPQWLQLTLNSIHKSPVVHTCLPSSTAHTFDWLTS
jgi:hypothetical protein